MNDLDWLARNVHEWPTSKDESIRLDHDGEICFRPSSAEFDYYPDDIESAKKAFVPDADCVLGKEYTYDQWLNRRAELQNKPTEWPDGADILVQNSDGKWCFGSYSNAVCDGEFGWNGSGVAFVDGDWMTEYDTQGTVVGDWRNTIERRPERKPSDKTAKALEEANNYSYATAVPYDDLQNGINIMTGVSPTLYMQQLGRAKRTKQWTGPEDGLPPVGTKCEINISLINGKPNWVSGTIVGHVCDEKEELAVIQMANDFTFRSASYFRPLRTEEDKLIDEWCKDIEESIEKFNVNIDCSAAIKATIVESVRMGYRKLDTPADND